MKENQFFTRKCFWKFAVLQENSKSINVAKLEVLSENLNQQYYLKNNKNLLFMLFVSKPSEKISLFYKKATKQQKFNILSLK